MPNALKRDYMVIGRLRDGVTVTQAQSDLRTIAAQQARSYPATNTGWTVRVEPLLDGINGEWTPLYYRLVMGATLFVLLVVCANVANLQFARGIARRPEIAMRTALGAGRFRLIRQLLTENILLGLIGAVGGIIVGGVLSAHDPRHHARPRGALHGRLVQHLAEWTRAGVFDRAGRCGRGGGRVCARAAGLAHQPGRSAQGGIADDGRDPPRNRRLKNIFAVAQISLAVALVIGAALISKGMRAMLHMADAYEPARMLTFNVQLPEARYDTPQKRAAWFAASLEKLRRMPGVTHAEVSQRPALQRKRLDAGLRD